MSVERHVIVLGYGRNGQRLARLLEAEGVRYVALDLDPERVREAALAGESVVFADSSRREALVAAGISRAVAAVVTYADVRASLRVLAHIHALNPAVPVIVVPEAFESGVMLASHTLVMAGVPLSRVMRRVSQVRDQQYSLLRGLFAGGGDDQAVARLHAVTLEAGAYAVGRELAEMDLGVQVRAVRRPGARLRLAPDEAGRLEAGDIVVLLGEPERLHVAEEKLSRGVGEKKAGASRLS